MCEQSEFYRDTWAEIDLDALYENMSGIRKGLPQKTNVFAAVKANAYGHGDIQTAKALLKAGVHGFVVALLDEALILRKSGIKAPILVLGATRPRDAGLAARFNISLTVFQIEWLHEAARTLALGERLLLHLKCDTGMGRIGIRSTDELQEIESFINHPDQSDRMMLEGIFTHFATADEADNSYYKRQLFRFEQFVAHLAVLPPYIHAANSAASLYHKDSIFNAVRIGIAMYGLSPSKDVKPVHPFKSKEMFSLHSKIIHVKKLSAGESVGYGSTYTADQDEWIATLPIGYADGWVRKLQGQHVLVAGEKAPIVGRICMDQLMIGLPHFIEVGTKATLIGRQGSQVITVDDIADKLDTINYEVVCMISNRVPRIYKQTGKCEVVVNKMFVE